MLFSSAPHIYTVHQRPNEIHPEEHCEFVRDAFSFPAFVLPAVWLLTHRCWLAFGAFFLFQLGLAALLKAGHIHMLHFEIALFIVQLGIGFSFADILRARLKKQGYLLVDIVTGDSEIRAKHRYFERLLGSPAPSSSLQVAVV